MSQPPIEPVSPLKTLRLPSRGLQQTLQNPVTLEGPALHGGGWTRTRLLPADPETGLAFVRADLPERPELTATSARLLQAQGFTGLEQSPGLRVRTLEHFLAAFHLLELDNVRVELMGEEPPILDGSVAPILDAIQASGGTKLQNRPVHCIVIQQDFILRLGDSWAQFSPGEGFELTVSIDFGSSWIGQQTFHYIQGETPQEALAPARTFCLLSQVSALQAAGLGQGGGLTNTLVIGENGPLNPEGLRFPDEPVRHKTLDLLGDLRLLNGWLEGHVRVHRPGHAFHATMIERIQAALRGGLLAFD